MTAKWWETLLGSVDQKRQYRQYKARITALPEPYREAAQAFDRYFMHLGGITDGPTLVRMLTDFADLWEQAAADATPVRAIVGQDPVEFAEAFMQSYSGRHWMGKERARLVDVIDQVTGDQS